ncbi:hypothetical protein E1B28_001216 [Marasmius oreades]|uniref:Uncharacterized protein n=1 Tax=Marasmius oreades TaxID=181124 RepID=A0A9P8AFF0_9AGAR|nr:uncharacterized protein E1B28_001216 [Marasmius oreades]KAG7099360.1 hypothetical protein E1B28_001216 [Marasmius oreades]
MSELPPPTYSQRDQDNAESFEESQSDASPPPQILIVPTVVNFQKGFLGAEGERAAIEGELQLKGANPTDWNKVTVGLRTVEAAYSREIELNVSEVVLVSQAPDIPSTSFPSSMLFAIPLMQDTPQTIITPVSYLKHTLTATLHPSDPLGVPVFESLSVHTKRYTSHDHMLSVNPEKHKLIEPTLVEVEVPRTTFKSGEPIPVYVKIPPPRRELVINKSLRLRNIKAELVRITQIREEDGDEGAINVPSKMQLVEGTSTASFTQSEKPRQLNSSKNPVSPHSRGPSFTAVIARSGASCRFHSSRTVQQRFILHQLSPLSTPSNASLSLPGSNSDGNDGDVETSSISQVTLLHSVYFEINIHVSFVDVSAHSECVFTVSIPISVLPPPAPLPEVEPGMDVAYQKKHDRPPVKTNRYDDSEHSVPHYSLGEPGPSGQPHGAPPPFDEPDAPPPFFSSTAEASTSARLPTFLESETEIIIPDDVEQHHAVEHLHPIVIEGEGVVFGFPASEQFDGHPEDIQRSSTPPPSLEMASRDADVTRLADIPQSDHTLGVIGLVLNRAEPPPPPPALDDPSDPPPSIDSDFRSPDASRHSPPPPGTSPPHMHTVYPTEPNHLHPPSSAPTPQDQTGHGHAPPPYLVRESHTEEQEHVTKPPPYAD